MVRASSPLVYVCINPLCLKGTLSPHGAVLTAEGSVCGTALPKIIQPWSPFHPELLPVLVKPRARLAHGSWPEATRPPPLLSTSIWRPPKRCRPISTVKSKMNCCGQEHERLSSSSCTWETTGEAWGTAAKEPASMGARPHGCLHRDIWSGWTQQNRQKWGNSCQAVLHPASHASQGIAGPWLWICVKLNQRKHGVYMKY